MSRWRKRPVVIEACQFHSQIPHIHNIDGTGACPLSAVEWAWHPTMGHTGPCSVELCGARQPVIRSLEGPHTVSEGDWIIRGIKGEHYACRPDIFEATYEPA